MTTSHAHEAGHVMTYMYHEACNNVSTASTATPMQATPRLVLQLSRLNCRQAYHPKCTVANVSTI